MNYKSVRGMEDILPGDTRIWRWLEDAARKTFEFYGYEEIRTPILEETPIFSRSIGETSDIVKKEMYTFKDKKGRPLSLRPEGTAPIVRAYIEHGLHKISPELKLYYIGPMFRSERPQKGRSRQFHQIGVEVFGARPSFDAELIAELEGMLKTFGLTDFTVKINTLGCEKDKSEFSEKLKKYLELKKNRLCEDCKDRIKRNVLRVLDCKKESCMGVVREAPDILDSLCPQCKDDFDKLKNNLEALKIGFKESRNLVRGLDYYTGTVFEVTHPLLGSQDAIGAGGRYDKLVKDFGGPDIPAIGYALGIERLLIALRKETPPYQGAVIYIATLGDKAKIKCVQITEKIKKELLGRVIVLTDPRGASLKSQMRSADKNNAKLVLILGENELEKGKIVIRDMATKEQAEIGIDNVADEIGRRIILESEKLKAKSEKL